MIRSSAPRCAAEAGERDDAGDSVGRRELFCVPIAPGNIDPVVLGRRAKNKRKEKLGQAKFTLKEDRDCPSVWDGGN